MKLNLYYPAKPYIITQAWGIYNPAYQQFGFSRHNGIDFAVDKDGIVKAMCDATVTEVGNYPTGAGLAVRYRTDLMECEGVDCFVEFMYMHGAKQLVTVGQKLKAGDPVIVADNTGFSTGPHTHISGYRINEKGERLDQNDANNTFDFSKYYNGLYADDIGSPAHYYFGVDLKRGDVSEDVKYLQRFLADKGYLSANDIIGVYGPKTQKAVYNSQVEYQAPLGMDWIYKGRYFGQKTRAHFNKIFSI